MKKINIILLFQTRIGISKKHKEVSSMVAKWQKVQQNFENT